MASQSPGLANPDLLTEAEPFGYKTLWFAIRSEDTSAVAEALEVVNLRSVNWEYGVWQGYSDDYQIFVSPPVHGWVLAMGVPILYEADGHAPERMVDLSKQFGEVQFFANMRTSCSYIWARATQDRLVR